MVDFKVKFEIRIDWIEIDLFGHINKLTIMKYVQAAREFQLGSLTVGSWTK
jgi:acyl-CoA thioesterase FadM